MLSKHWFNCHHSMVVSQMPQGCFWCSSCTFHFIVQDSTRPHAAHSTSPLCRPTAVCQTAVHFLVAQIVAVLLRRSHDVPSAIQSDSRALSCCFLQADSRQIRDRFQKMYPADVFTTAWSKYLESLYVTSSASSSKSVLNSAGTSWIVCLLSSVCPETRLKLI